MIWSSPSIIFRWEFSREGDYVIQRLHFDNIWYGHHQASFFSENSVVKVIMSSEDYILIIYDMVITKHHFSVRIKSWRWLCHLETAFWWYMIWSFLVRSQDPRQGSSPNHNVKAKIQDKEVHLNTKSKSRFRTRKPTKTQCQGQDPRQIVSSGDYFLIIQDIVITKHYFFVRI